MQQASGADPSDGYPASDSDKQQSTWLRAKQEAGAKAGGRYEAQLPSWGWLQRVLRHVQHLQEQPRQRFDTSGF